MEKEEEKNVMSIKDLRKLLTSVLSTRKKISASQQKRLDLIFRDYENEILKVANFASEKLEKDWPDLMAKTEQLENLVYFFNGKWICKVDPEKSTKSEIIKNTEIFDVGALFEEEEIKDEEDRVSEEARKGLESVID